MGNRAVITTPAKTTGVYVHWNGGVESVTGFCEACKELGFRSPAADPAYGFACLVTAIFAFFGASGLSVGVGPLETLDCDNFDNGVYVIDANWKIVERYGDGSKPLAPLADDERVCADQVKERTIGAVTAIRDYAKQLAQK